MSLLFLLEIKKSILDIFADDTILSWSGSSVEQVKDDFNEDAQDAVTWCVTMLKIKCQ